MKLCPSNPGTNESLFEPDPLIPEMILLGIFISFTILEIILVVKCMYIISKLDVISKKNLLFIIQTIFYISSIIFFILRVCTTICNCFAREYYRVIWASMGISYVVHWMLFLIILHQRLIIVFNETPFKISNLCTSLSHLNWILVMIGAIICLIFFISHMISTQIVLALMVVFLVDVIIFGQVLAWTFVWKLIRLNKNKNSFNVTLIDTITKYTILSLITVMFTSINTMSLLYDSITDDWSYFNQSTQSIAFCFDILLDTICLWLTFSQNYDKYKCLCNICDKRCKYCCILCCSDNNIDTVIDLKIGNQPNIIPDQRNNGEETHMTIYDTETKRDITQTQNEGRYYNSEIKSDICAINDTEFAKNVAKNELKEYKQTKGKLFIHSINMNNNRYEPSFTSKKERRTDALVATHLAYNEQDRHQITKGNDVDITPM